MLDSQYDSEEDVEYNSRSSVKLVRALLPGIAVKPVQSDGISPSEPLECSLDFKYTRATTDQVSTCWFPREEAVKEKQAYRSRHTITLPKIRPQLLRPGFGSYLKRIHGEVDPSAAWTAQDSKLHNQRLLVAGRFVYHVCTAFDIALPSLPEEADRILVNAIGNSNIFSRFSQVVASTEVAASTQANHAQALVHATNYALEQLCNKASSADEGALVRVFKCKTISLASQTCVTYFCYRHLHYRQPKYRTAGTQRSIASLFVTTPLQ